MLPIEIEFKGKIWYWRGPSPWYFVTVPEAESQHLKDVLSMVTYGWGMVPATVRIGKTEFKTALWPKDGAYIVPLKTTVRKAEKLNEGDHIKIRIKVG